MVVLAAATLAHRVIFFTSAGSRRYKVGFAAGSLLHSVAKVLKDVSGVRVLESAREDIGRWSENTSSLLCMRDL